MAESSSSNQAIVETGAAVAATPGEMPATLPPVMHDANGVPVVDLRGAPGKDGAFVVVDGELVIRLADGTEWPVSTSGDEAEIVLQLADQAFVGASAVAAALESFDTALPVAELTETALREAGAFPASAVETVAAPQGEAPANVEERVAEEEPVEPVSGGAAFRTLELVSLGETLSPTMQLDPTSLGQDDGARGPGTPPDARSTAAGAIAINLAPVAGNDSATTSERQSVEIDILGNDRDPNKNDDIELVDVDTTGLVGDVTVNPDGSLSYDPNGQFTHLGKGETATERFTYTVVDSQGATDTATVEVTVTGVNDTPIAVDDTVVTDERTVVALDLLSNDSDPDTNDTLAIAAVDTAGLAGILGLLPDGSLAYSPNGAFTHLGLGEQAIDTFLYAVADQHGAFSIAEVSVLIAGVNDAPIATDDLVVVSEDGEGRFDALANDIDPDTNDTLRVTSLHSLGNSHGQRWINHDGTITYRPFGAYEYLGEGEIAYQQFGYTVADQHGAADTGVVTVAVVGKNDAPVANDDHATTDEKSPIILDIFANDFDVDLNDIVVVTNIDASSLQGQLFITPEDTLGYDPNGQFLHLGVGEQAIERFTYTLTDQHGASSTATVEVTVTGVNDAPTAVTDAFVGFENVGFYAPIDALLANDFDVDGDHFAFAGLGPAVNGEVSLTPDGYVVFKPFADYTGDASFQYAIQDEYGAFGFGEVDVHVREIAPGDIQFESLSWFSGVSEASTSVAADGTTLIDTYTEIGAIAATGMTIGGMPFFTAMLTGILQGVISVAIGPDSAPIVDGAVVGDLDLQIETSPIFTGLGGDVYDTLLAAVQGPGQPQQASAPTTLPDLGDLSLESALQELLGDAIEMIDLGDMSAGISGFGIGDAAATAFGDGTFYLDIAGLISGAVTVPGANDDTPLVDAELFGEFAGVAAIDIRDGLAVLADGSLDGDFQASVAPTGIDSGFAVGALVTEEAIAA